jgi:hypothetical protein
MAAAHDPWREELAPLLADQHLTRADPGADPEALARAWTLDLLGTLAPLADFLAVLPYHYPPAAPEELDAPAESLSERHAPQRADLLATAAVAVQIASGARTVLAGEAVELDDLLSEVETERTRYEERLLSGPEAERHWGAAVLANLEGAAKFGALTGVDGPAAGARYAHVMTRIAALAIHAAAAVDEDSDAAV